jgi:copper chaperone CopZ
LGRLNDVSGPVFQAFFFCLVMRNMILLVLLGLSLGAPLTAGDGAMTRYTAVVTGIVCQSCKATVVESLKKLPGVRDIEFAKGDTEGSHKLTFESASGNLTKSDAEHALGEHAKEFAVLSLDKVK